MRQGDFVILDRYTFTTYMWSFITPLIFLTKIWWLRGKSIYTFPFLLLLFFLCRRSKDKIKYCRQKIIRIVKPNRDQKWWWGEIQLCRQSRPNGIFNQLEKRRKKWKILKHVYIIRTENLLNPINYQEIYEKFTNSKYVFEFKTFSQF